ncbi:hypothetical protein [Ethanoligenens harbinense]|uniref:Uncharacterized protein n=1 Tax=Ethanoligenens harbinense (strain DSM 18485 / JCM 12961 / CGMCC 1.5033 / YUAN-3) TaxID=663278 RepID=E6U7J4_ETHHY|nr:hypothetical protein [Ethanoligenens harbinense]ADU27017.1 hypothetical protein Ethha_1480 [Ethanoligenens harbinense YUAN-3]AVQ96104.1 hypothetical protein CXQ68_07610 [Ethanoligenens harbinense YUAN-3]AYF38765.1 hypothetical protein CXP51_07480 [Ethanoligenens harbinense]AYF41513.1 hypothetical protein CN246_07620 [Ethanoligenens harbinense]QCN92345.1 hypothetical protein DRA42_07640 [Ethanoligenens harbinense]
MLPKIHIPAGDQTSSTLKTIVVITSIFLSLAVIVALFYTFFQKCDRLKFTYLKKDHRHASPAESEETDPEVDSTEDPAY